MTSTHRLPQDKSDEEAVRALGKLTPPFEPAIVAGLFAWTADSNWPISGPVIRLLLRAPEQIVPHVTAVMRGDDETWKWHLISLLMGCKDCRPAARMLRSELVRLSTSIDPRDIREDVPEIAAEAVAWIDGGD